MITAFRIFVAILVAILLVCLVVFVSLLLGCSSPNKSTESRTIVAAFVGVQAALAQLPEWNPALDKELESRAMVASYFSLSAAMIQHPECEAACRLALEHIKVALKEESMNVDDVLSIFNLLPIKELRSNTTVIFPTGSTVSIQKDLGMLEVVETPDELRGILRGIGKGLVLARPEWRGVPALKPPPLPFGRNALYDERSRKRR